MVRKMVCETLAAHGYQVIEAQNVADGLQRAAETKQTIHLLLTDVIMPEMNGREFHQKVLAFHPEIQVLYMSGYTDNVIVHHGILEEGVNFLQKPLPFRILYAKLDRFWVKVDRYYAYTVYVILSVRNDTIPGMKCQFQKNALDTIKC
ncbi:MAG: response regulator [Chloroflexota bacterium]